jgi:hypothetical protein
MENPSVKKTSLTIAVTASTDVVAAVLENPQAEILMTAVLGDLTAEDRVDAAALLMDRIKAERAFFKEQADRFRSAVSALDRIQEQLKDSIKLNMVSRGISSLEGNTIRFSLAELEPRLEYDEKLIPESYKVPVVTMKVDDSRLRKELGEGKRVEGATLVPSFRLASYVNRKLKATGA